MILRIPLSKREGIHQYGRLAFGQCVRQVVGCGVIGKTRRILVEAETLSLILLDTLCRQELARGAPIL